MKMAHIDDIGSGAAIATDPEIVAEHDPESDFFPLSETDDPA
jgi:ribonuclease D